MIYTRPGVQALYIAVLFLGLATAVPAMAFDDESGTADEEPGASAAVASLPKAQEPGVDMKFALRNKNNFQQEIKMVFKPGVDLAKVASTLSDLRLLDQVSEKVVGANKYGSSERYELAIVGEANVPILGPMRGTSWFNCAETPVRVTWTRSCSANVKKGDTSKTFKSGGNEIACNETLVDGGKQVTCLAKAYGLSNKIAVLVKTFYNEQQVAVRGAVENMRTYALTSALLNGEEPNLQTAKLHYDVDAGHRLGRVGTFMMNQFENLDEKPLKDGRNQLIIKGSTRNGFTESKVVPASY